MWCVESLIMINFITRCQPLVTRQPGTKGGEKRLGKVRNVFFWGGGFGMDGGHL